MKRRRMTPSGVTLVLILALVPAGAARAAEEDKAAHGGFSGQIKPVLYVVDVEASAEFYRDVLGFAFDGFSMRDDAPYYAEMAAADQKFGLHLPMNDRDRARVGHQRLYFRVGSLETHRARVEAWGAMPSDVVRRDWMDYFVVLDPDGHEIVFAETDPQRHGSNPW